MGDDASIRINGEEVRNPVLRKAIGTALVALFVLLFFGVILLMFFLPFVLLMVVFALMGIAMVITVVAYPFDWVLKRLGRVGIIHTNGYGNTYILDRRMFAKVSQKTEPTPES